MDEFYVYDGKNEYNQISWVKEKARGALYSILAEIKYKPEEYKKKCLEDVNWLDNAFSYTCIFL